MCLGISRFRFELISTLNNLRLNAKRLFLCGLLFSTVCLLASSFATAQTATPSEITEHLQAGEFSVALKLADSLPTNSRDQWLSKISEHQYSSGAYQTAYDTAGMIDGELSRSNSLSSLYANHNPPPEGLGGGITESDFQP